jgi:hypothetical protein
MKARMGELEREKVNILARLAEAPAGIPDIHPNIASVYRRNVERFTEALNDPDGGRETAEAEWFYAIGWESDRIPFCRTGMTIRNMPEPPAVSTVNVAAATTDCAQMESGACVMS